ncbi:hypothetical protein [Luteolibacter sp. Populi]|uniref:hypothetical protein n=1 Tax=Luteolibacter sp. Populi TaxID=3230487 RepID=UPI003467AE01
MEADDDTLRGTYGDFPATAVFIRKSDLVDTAYLVSGETVFGYYFTFHKPGGSDSPLWQEGIADFLRATFPAETFKHQERSPYTSNNIYHRCDLVMNLKAQELANRSFKEFNAARLREAAIGGASSGTKVPESPQSRTIADYLKSFPETTKAEPVGGRIADSFDISEFPADAFYRRKAADNDLIIAVHQGNIIGYLVLVPIPSGGGELPQAAVAAGLATAFPDPVFKREPTGSINFFYSYRIIDRAAHQTARDAHLAEQAAKLKAALNP